MDGLIYLLNQAGIALAEANQQIHKLVEENAQLYRQLSDEDQ